MLRFIIATAAIVALTVTLAVAREVRIPDTGLPAVTFDLPETWTTRLTDQGVVIAQPAGRQSDFDVVTNTEVPPAAFQDGADMDMVENGRTVTAIHIMISGLHAYKYQTGSAQRRSHIQDDDSDDPA